jgi:hypothetical protein
VPVLNLFKEMQVGPGPAPPRGASGTTGGGPGAGGGAARALRGARAGGPHPEAPPPRARAPPAPPRQDQAPGKRWSDQWLLEDGLHFNAAGQAWFAKLLNDFIWSNAPGARTDALPYHHPAWEDVNYADSAVQFAQERGAAA